MSNPTDLVHVMVDVETLGMNESAKLLSIGAIVFCPKKDLGDGFYQEISMDSQIGTFCPSTIKFWFEQAAKGTFPPTSGTKSIWVVVAEFREYLHKVCDGKLERLVIWANGTDFDIPKLLYTFGETNYPVPWKYNSVRDCRTIFKTFPTYGLKPPSTDKHNALADAVYQAEYLISIVKNLSEFGVTFDEFPSN